MALSGSSVYDRLLPVLPQSPLSPRHLRSTELSGERLPAEGGNQLTSEVKAVAEVKLETAFNEDAASPEFSVRGLSRTEFISFARAVIC